jgi:hypothetical protein
MRPPVRPFALAIGAAILVGAPATHAQSTTPGAPPDARPGIPAAGQDSVRASASGPAAAVESALGAQVDSVDALARGGITAVPIPAAIALIDGLEPRLRESTRPALRSIAGDLRALRGQLGAPSLDRRRVGDILARVGPKVTTVARTQSGAVRAALQNIGSQLTAAGRQLASGVDG